MISDCVLVQVPSIDFNVLLGITHKALGRNLAGSSDASRRNPSDAERFLSCLAAIRDEHAPAGLSPRLLTHVSFSALIGADDRDMQDILQCCAGMSFVTTETIIRGTQVAVVTGTLAQWRDAVASGCFAGLVPTVRHCFNKLYGLFCSAGLNVWGEFRTRQAPDHTFYLLEDKR
jgi:hypothetical protein